VGVVAASEAGLAFDLGPKFGHGVVTKITAPVVVVAASRAGLAANLGPKFGCDEDHSARCGCRVTTVPGVYRRMSRQSLALAS
jgi:hypothetical protein